MLIIPSMDDWFQLVRRNKEYQKKSLTLLKDYGVMMCMSFIAENFSHGGKEIRVLEMGHGFSPAVMSAFQAKHEVWGCDENQGLHYFDATKWEDNYQRAIVATCPDVKLVRGLVGSINRPANLPLGYFDVVYSISILEEVPVSALHAIVRSAADLLKPGGWLIGTHDLRGGFIPDRLKAYLEIHRDAGLDLGDVPDPATVAIHWEYALLEHPAMVMLGYQRETPEETRRYIGHWTTMFTAAQKTL